MGLCFRQGCWKYPCDGTNCNSSPWFSRIPEPAFFRPKALPKALRKEIKDFQLNRLKSF